MTTSTSTQGPRRRRIALDVPDDRLPKGRARPPVNRTREARSPREHLLDRRAPRRPFSDHVRFSPRRLWVSSANFTYASRRSLEFGYWTEQTDLVRAAVFGGMTGGLTHHEPSPLSYSRMNHRPPARRLWLSVGSLADPAAEGRSAASTTRSGAVAAAGVRGAPVPRLLDRPPLIAPWAGGGDLVGLRSASSGRPRGHGVGVVTGLEVDGVVAVVGRLRPLALVVAGHGRLVSAGRVAVTWVDERPTPRAARRATPA
jgi:hypothetical protein